MNSIDSDAAVKVLGNLVFLVRSDGENHPREINLHLFVRRRKVIFRRAHTHTHQRAHTERKRKRDIAACIIQRRQC
jgi:hypothetical protein